MKPVKIILDTNIWISFLLTDRFIRIDDLIRKEMVIVLFSDELIMEFITVSQKPKFRKFFDASDIEDILALLYNHGKHIRVKSSLSLCRDEKDNFLLNLAVDGHADYLVTGDEDLLELKKVKKTKIITIYDFTSKHAIR